MEHQRMILMIVGCIVAMVHIFFLLYRCTVLLIRYKVQIGFIYKDCRDSVPALGRLMLDISMSPDIQEYWYNFWPTNTVIYENTSNCEKQLLHLKLQTRKLNLYSKLFRTKICSSQHLSICHAKVEVNQNLLIGEHNFIIKFHPSLSLSLVNLCFGPCIIILLLYWRWRWLKPKFR